MECRTFEITLISANNLERLTWLLRMKVYAKVSICGATEVQRRSPTDWHGGSNPAWNFTARYNLNEQQVQHFGTMLVVKLFSWRRLACDRYIGEVHTSLKELFDIAEAGGGSAVLTLPVQIGSANSQGAVRFSYRFGERVSIDKMLLAESLAGWSHC